MQFDIISIFPEIFNFYFKESLISRALKKKLIKIKVHNLRDWASDKHKTVDDKPFGGGLGMVMKIEPIYRAVNALQLRNRNKSKIVLFSPRGKKFNQRIAYQFSKLDQLILICGRYEGVDERVAKYIADIKLSIGDYVLMGGEIPAMTVIETVSRLIPGVIAKEQLLKERVTSEKGFVEYPQYTRPEIFITKDGKKLRVPKILLSGNHQEIEKWREKNQKIIEK